MQHRITPLRIGLLAVVSAAIAALAYAAFGQSTEAGLFLLANGAALDFNAVMKAIDTLEGKLTAFHTKAEGELKTVGQVSGDTKTAIETLGTEQRTLADRLTQLEQKGLTPPAPEAKAEGWGAQVIKAGGDSLDAFRGRHAKHFGVEIKNTISNTVGNTPDMVRPGIVGGPSRILRLEDLMTRMPCNSDAVQFVRENVFTNAAAETTEATGTLPESSITTTLVTEPVATVGHWLKISRQLAADNAALAVYIEQRLRYGVDLRVDNQIFGGNGVAPNISGITKSGNFTAHGYTSASLTALGLDPAKRFDLIGKMIGDCAANDYPADVILLNPADWWNLRLTKGSDGHYILGNPGENVAPMLWGVPVVASNAVTADTVAVAGMNQAATFYDRETVEVGMSESDGDNFTKLLITLRAHRRCMLAVERPAAIRYGDLTPA